MQLKSTQYACRAARAPDRLRRRRDLQGRGRKHRVASRREGTIYALPHSICFLTAFKHAHTARCRPADHPQYLEPQDVGRGHPPPLDRAAARRIHASQQGSIHRTHLRRARAAPARHTDSSRRSRHLPEHAHGRASGSKGKDPSFFHVYSRLFKHVYSITFVESKACLPIPVFLLCPACPEYRHVVEHVNRKLALRWEEYL